MRVRFDTHSCSHQHRLDASSLGSRLRNARAVTLQQHGYTPQMLLPGVKVTPAGLPRVIDLQLMGYQRLSME